jgi:UBX domain-containing protein 1
MSNIRRLFDRSGSSDDDSERKNASESFAGGHRSGLAVQYPDDTTRNSGALKIRLFDNGFIVESGEFRSFADPLNVEFMSKLRSGEIPDTLKSEATSSRGEIKVELSQYSGDYNPSNHTFSNGSASGKKQSFQSEEPSLFRGEGSILGGSQSSQSATISEGDIPVPTIPDGSTRTTLQIRLPGGSRVTRSFCDNSSASFLLDVLAAGLNVPAESLTISSGFPPRPISIPQMSRSLKELGLCNSAVVVSVSKT